LQARLKDILNIFFTAITGASGIFLFRKRMGRMIRSLPGDGLSEPIILPIGDMIK
jgi:hypothetical protein